MATGLAAGVALAVGDRGDQFERAALRQEQDAAEFAARLSADMDERVQDMLLLAQLDTFADAAPRQQRMVLDQVLASTQAYAWLGVTDDAGLVQASSPSSLLQGMDVSQRPWFGEGRQGLFVGDLHEAVLLADALGSAEGPAPRFVDIAVPLVDADIGEPTGVLAAHLFWSWTEDLRAQQLMAAPDDGRQFLILGDSGEVLLPPRGVASPTASPRPVDGIVGDQGRGVLRWTDGDFVTGWAVAGPTGAFSGLGWTVLARRPAGPLATHSLLLGAQIVAAALVAAALVAAVLLWWVRRATDQIDTITDAAQRLRDGEDTEIPMLEGSREVAVLSAALRELTEHLAARQRELEDRNRQLADASRAREHFTMMASHETRTPITIVKGCLQTLRKHHHQLASEEQARLFDAAWRNIQRLERLTSHMLVAAELERGPSEAVRPLVTVAAGELLATLAPEDVAVEGPSELLVCVDPSLVELTVGNLLDNAAKYGQPPVGLAFSHGDDVLEVRVRDHGPGVPEAFVDRLFQRHAQASEGLRRTAVGAGLGLWLSRELLRAAGGDLTHDHVEGPGTAFTAKIPTQPVDLDADGMPGPSRTADRPRSSS